MFEILITLISVALTAAAAYIIFQRMYRRKLLEQKLKIRELEAEGREIRAREDRLRRVIDNVNEAVVAVTSEFEIVFFNRPFVQIFGANQPIESNSYLTDFVRSADLSNLVKEVVSTGNPTKKVLEIAVRNERKSTEVQIFSLSLGDEALVAIAFYDLTEIANAEKMKRDFIANASHQLKTPLTAIQGYAEILIEDSTLGSKLRKEFLKKIQMRSLEAADLAGRLLRLSKLESDTQIIQFSSFSVKKIVRDVEKKFESQIKKKELKVLFEGTAEDVELRTDVSLFQLVLENLFENATKYSLVGGKIFLRVDAHPGEVEIEIRDQGIGIPKEDQSKVFERFFRSSNAESHSHDGVGIGMAMVKSALDKMKATIRLESDMNEGTAIFLRFPTQEARDIPSIAKTVSL